MIGLREIDAGQVQQTVARLCQEAATLLPDDVLQALRKARETEEAPLARKVLDQILRNAELAGENLLPLCQDTGTAVVFLEIGQDVHIVGGDLHEAIVRGVGQSYTAGYLRASIVEKPFSARVNTKNNTPPVIHSEIVPGDKLRIKVLPKGGGCENMSRFTIMLPGEGKKGITDFVLRTVEESGGNPCPPVIVGVGIGGTAETAMLLAKKAITRRVGQPHLDAETAEFEQELLEKVNALGLGPQAVGGRTTALAVHIETHPTHITSLPVAVNLQCHSARLKEAVL
jgi:fumarate hydratase subunit alpha